MESIGSYESDIDDLDCFEATELRLGLPGSNASPKAANSTSTKGNKRALETTLTTRSSSTEESTCQETTPPVKVQVVGWPPVQSFRRNSFHVRKAEEMGTVGITGEHGIRGGIGGIMVKVSMDGAPYLRKIDLMMYQGYKELRLALDDMFKSFSMGESTITYEDKDGDWMLVGDVPWEMFASSCKKLRIMRGA